MKADQILVEEARDGNKSAFSQLVQRHQKTMLRVALRMTRDLEMAEDIVQDSFIKAYKKLDLFEGRASFKSWLYQITINTAKNKLRVRRYDQVDVENANLAVEGIAEGHLIQSDLRGLLKSEVKRLPDKQQQALTLRIFEDLSFKEIAQIMQCPYDTAKANYRHGLMKLRHRFQESVTLKNLQDFDHSIPVVYQSPVAEV